MKTIYLLTVWALLTMSTGTTRAQDPPSPVYASRIEIRSFASLTLSDEQFLKGDPAGPAVQLSAELRLPAHKPVPRFPAVILMHGSGGINASGQAWANLLNRAGYATFMVDSFSGRGLTQVSTDQARLGRFAGVLDAFRAYEELAKHPRIDAQRVAVLGTSRGGTAVIYTAMRRFQSLWSPSFKAMASFALYPSCFDRLDQDEQTSMPIHAFHGGIDDYASKVQCVAWLERLRAAGQPATNTDYPMAPHGFDNPLSPITPTVSKDAQSTRLCRISEQAGALINIEEGRPFSYKDRCVTLGPSVGYEPKATAMMQQAILNELHRLATRQ